MRFLSIRCRPFRRLDAAAAIALLSGPLVIVADAQPSRVHASLDSAATAALSSSGTPGMAVVVMRGRDTLLARGYGVGNAERRPRVSASSVFQIGSLTKSFTAAGILALASANRLRLTDTVGVLIAGYTGPARSVSVTALLSHTAGVPNYVELPEFRSRAASLDGPADVMRLFASLPLDFVPGTRWAYSNSGYLLLGRITEERSGVDWDEFIVTRVAKPAGLTSTRVCSPSAPADVAGHDVENGRVTPTAPVDPAIPYAAGALCSSALDLARWMTALADGSVFPVDSYRAMITPVKLANGTTASYGYGLEVTDLAGHLRVGHGGAIAGYDAYASRYPADSLVVVVLMNRAGANAEALEKQLARIALGLREIVVAERPLAPSEAARYVGQFRAGGGRLRVTVRGARLHIDGPVDADLKRVGEHDFVLANEPDVRVQFVVVGELARSITWTSRGRTMSLPRLP